HLFAELLAVGERSALFHPGGMRVKELVESGDDLRFFYLRSESDLARVDVPAWVTADPAALDRLHAALLHQAGVGIGYPLALAEAHEQAVVRAADRAAFYALVERTSAREGLHLHVSP